jgi:hypothetical protein
LDSNFVVNLYGNSNLSKQPEIIYLRNEKNYTQGDEKWSNDSGQMVLAKVNLDGKVYDITTKTDLNAVEKVMTLKRMEEAGVDNPVATYNENPYQAKKDYGVDNLINKIHLLKDNIQLHPMLERYNLMDYLFTQQLMCSTVGSHVAHPSKAKLKTPIIWKNPNTQYIQKNPDKFIEVSPTIDSLSDQELLEAWEKLKTQANNENKILITSSTRLKQLAGADFNYSIEASKDLHTIDSALD